MAGTPTRAETRKLEARGLRHVVTAVPQITFDLISADREKPSRIALFVFVLAWLPVFVLSAANGTSALRGYLLDFAAQSRLFVVVPLLTLTEKALVNRWSRITQHFEKGDLLKEEDSAGFQVALDRFERRRRSRLAQIIALVILFCVGPIAITYLPNTILPPWCRGVQVMNALSVPGAWYLFVSVPLIDYIVFRWLWFQAACGRFLYRVSKLHLRLVAAHPDRMAGLGFLETSLRGYLPFAFAIGTIVAGVAANQLVHGNQSLTEFKSVALLMIAIVVVFSAGPLCVFFGALLRAKRLGTFHYGELATDLGHKFEARWLQEGRDEAGDILEVQDFSATTDLYSIVRNVNEMQPLPFGRRSILRLIAYTLAPAIPVSLVFVPFRVLIDKAAKLIF